MRVPALANRSKGETPLHTACKQGDTAIILLLLEAGSNPNQPDHREKTPVHMAAALNNPEVIAALEKGKIELDWAKRDY